MSSTPALGRLGLPERGQTMLVFGGGVHYRPIRPGPLPQQRTLVETTLGAPVIGGISNIKALPVFELARNRSENLAAMLNDAWDSDHKAQTRHRTAYTREEKPLAIKYLEEMWVPAEKGVNGKKDRNAAKISLSYWRKTAVHIDNQKKYTRRSRDVRKGVGREHEVELRLYALFKEARGAGLGCGASWFMRHAREIYRDVHPERCTQREGGRWEHNGFEFSGGWFQGFRRRFEISNLCSTKQAHVAPDDVRSTLQSFLQFNRRQTIILDGSYLGLAPSVRTIGMPAMVGRFILSQIANMDQMPLAFDFLDNRTYEHKGSKTFWLKELRSGWDRHQATLQICVFADGVQRCKLQLIFSGAEKRHRVRELEEVEYHKGVEVLWNKEAWANECTILHWIKHQYKPATDSFAQHQEPRLLVLDAFRAHLTPDVQRELGVIHCTGSFIPGGCTGYVQPLDVARKKPLNDLIKSLSDKDKDKHAVEHKA